MVGVALALEVLLAGGVLFVRAILFLERVEVNLLGLLVSRVFLEIQLQFLKMAKLHADEFNLIVHSAAFLDTFDIDCFFRCRNLDALLFDFRGSVVDFSEH